MSVTPPVRKGARIAFLSVSAEPWKALDHLMAVPVPFRCLVPADTAGFIIGRGGHERRRIEEETGAGLTVLGDHEVPQELADKVVVINGSTMQKEVACRHVVEKIRQVQRVSAEEDAVFVASVPGQAMFAVVGEGGTQIKEVAELSGAEVVISRECIFGTNDWPVSITGSAQSVVSAAAQIIEIIDDLVAQGVLCDPVFLAENDAKADFMGTGSRRCSLRTKLQLQPAMDERPKLPHARDVHSAPLKRTSARSACSSSTASTVSRRRPEEYRCEDGQHQGWQPAASTSIARARSVPAAARERLPAETMHQGHQAARCTVGGGDVPLGFSAPTRNELALLGAIQGSSTGSHQIALILSQALIRILSAQGFFAAAEVRSGAKIRIDGEVLVVTGAPMATALAALYLQEKMLQLGVGR